MKMEIAAFITALILLWAAARVAMPRVAGLRRTRRRARYRDVPLPHLIVPTFPGATDIVPAGVSREPIGAASRTAAEVAAAEVATGEVVPERVAMPDVVPQHADRPVGPQETPAPMADITAAEAAPPRKRRKYYKPTAERERELARWKEPAARQEGLAGDSPDATTTFRRPRNEHVQVLPARLQVLSGDAAGQNLRLFSRVGEKPRILVGREPGPAHRCITLRSPTVSRRHARMECVDGQWTITNLSETNPVLVNDHALTGPSSARALSNGDRIELGEVALRFLAS